MEKFLTLSFWLDAHPVFFSLPAYWTLLIVCLAAIAFGLVSTYLTIKVYQPRSLANSLWTRLGSWAYGFGLVGLLLTFLKQQRTPYLGMRLWFALWFLGFIVWLGFILKYIFIEVPKIKKEQQKKKELEKYLP